MEKYLELAVYRTTQELVTNVVKHAKATECRVSIDIGQQDIRIRVSDNGQGMEAAKTRKPGIGLNAIRSKTKLLNGDVRVDSVPGKGTNVEVIIPRAQTIKTNL
jgi:signal transduction histidine kinase